MMVLTFNPVRVVQFPQMSSKVKSSVILLVASGIAVCGFIAPSAQPKRSTDDLAIKAQKILEKNCSKCHDRNFEFDAKSRADIVATKKIIPGDPDGSRIIIRISKDTMPPAGTTPRPSAEDLQVLKDWVKAGAVDWTESATIKPQGDTHPTAIDVSEKQILGEIIKDLNQQPEEKRQYIRYFSSANLLRNPDTVGKIKNYETGMAKLINSLSWTPDIVSLQPFGTGNAIYRLNIHDVDWTGATWNRILSFYPYGFIPKNERGAVDQIHSLSGAAVPYVRVDWFVANASIPPLYHDILDLPKTVKGLEQKLGVDVERNQREDKIVRAGLSNSGVSRNNRAVERHRSLYGYYYKSFDFASNEGRKNIFQFPLDFKEDGGEFIFSLPNGLQGYLIAKADGTRLDVAPSTIVRDRSGTFDDVNVTNGLSCMSCHANGMQLFPNEVRQNLDTMLKAEFDLERAKIWYPPTQTFRDIQIRDAQKFESAVVKTGSQFPHNGVVPVLPQDEEPIAQVAVLYNLRPVSASYAAADCGLTVDEFKKRLNKSSDLSNRGLGLLLADNGSIKRDVWEQNFGRVVDELGIGQYIVPGHGHVEKGADPRTLVRIEVRDNSNLANRIKSQVFLALNRSDDIRPVTSGGDQVITLSVNESNQQVKIAAAITGHRFEAEGDSESIDDLSAKIADDIHIALAHRVVPSTNVVGNQTKSQPSNQNQQGSLVSTIAPSSTQQLLDLALRSGTISTAISIDKGPGSTYKIGKTDTDGEEIIVRFSANQDGFGAIYDIDSTGTVALLFPNKHSGDNRLQAGKVYSGDTWGLVANGTPGRERMFMLFASSNAQLPGVNRFISNPDAGGFVSKSVGAFARQIQSGSAGGNSNATGASFVEFFTANK